MANPRATLSNLRRIDAEGLTDAFNAMHRVLTDDGKIKQDCRACDHHPECGLHCGDTKCIIKQLEDK